MTVFDAYLVVDWSAKSSPTPKEPSPDAVWFGERLAEGKSSQGFYAQTRWDCEDFLRTRLLEYRDAGRRVFLGFDFPYGYPAGFAAAIGLEGSTQPWRLVWNELKRLIEDDENNANNRFVVAGELNARCHGVVTGPFWGCPVGRQVPGLAPKSPRYPYHAGGGRVLESKRETERLLGGTQPAWKLLGIGSVGGQALLGIPVVARLRDDPELQTMSQVWPFETGFAVMPVPLGRPFVLHAEIWPGVVNDMLDPDIPIKDQRQVRAMVDWLARLDAANELLPLFGTPSGLSGDRLRRVLNEEGWIFGSGLQSVSGSQFPNEQ